LRWLAGDEAELDWLEAEDNVMTWATEVIAVRYRELGLTTDQPVIDLTEQFCGEPDCPPHEVVICAMHPDEEVGEMAEISIPGGMLVVTRAILEEAVEVAISGEPPVKEKKEVVWREEDVNHTVLEDLFGM